MPDRKALRRRPARHPCLAVRACRKVVRRTPPQAAHKQYRRPREPRGGAGVCRLLDQLHFWVPVTVDIDGVPPGPVSAVNATLYGRLPLLQATDWA